MRGVLLIAIVIALVAAAIAGPEEKFTVSGVRKLSDFSQHNLHVACRLGSSSATDGLFPWTG